MALSKVVNNSIESVDASKLTGSLPASMSDITKQSSDPTISTNPSGGVGSIILNTSTGKMFVCTDATAGANVWQAGVDGSVTPFTGMVATGGTITTDGDYKVHSFTTSSQFVVTTLGTDAVVDYLVVAGGAGGFGDGGGGYQFNGGGGGAGGYRCSYNSETSGGGGSSETELTVTATTYTVTVGAGGGSAQSNGYPGANSVFSTITSIGGGGMTYPSPGGLSGGSGGGGIGDGGNAGGSGTANQGYAGGNGVAGKGGGGGGGAGAVGETPSTIRGGNGGVGLASSISGSSVFRAGGGGGASRLGYTPGTGGNGGGGAGAVHGATDGTVNSGGGGGGTDGGQAGNTSNPYYAPGGSGIVIIRYKFQ